LHGRGRIVGLDFSLAMLQRARAKKIHARHGAETEFVLGSALFSPFRAHVFDGVMTAFVLRNVSDLSIFFADAYRVLKPGGRFVSLDMFPPAKTLLSSLYRLYFYRLVPRIGGLLARDQSAYRYLSESVRQFHSPEAVSDMMRRCGFEQVSVKKFLNGAVCMHTAEKSAPSSTPD
jgi:demethylmenaquinone methyltransferase/2-methoxy-6-polyprenyl-1,4-benzoquinol methylase